MRPASGTLELTLQRLQASRRDVVRVEQALATVLEAIGRVSLGDVPPCTGLDQRAVRCLWQASVILDRGFDRVDLDLRTADRHLQATLARQVRLRLTECLIHLTRDAGPRADQPDLPDPGEFWKDRSIDELAVEQDVDPSAIAESLVGAGRELWEDDRELEAFVREMEAPGAMGCEEDQ